MEGSLNFTGICDNPSHSSEPTFPEPQALVIIKRKWTNYKNLQSTVKPV